MKVIKVKSIKPQFYNDANGDEYYQSEKGTIFKQVDGVWHDCTEEGEADCPVGKDVEIKIEESIEPKLKRIKLFEEFSLNEKALSISNVADSYDDIQKVLDIDDDEFKKFIKEFDKISDEYDRDDVQSLMSTMSDALDAAHIMFNYDKLNSFLIKKFGK